jgi:phosphate transport system substrate-binding protein
MGVLIAMIGLTAACTEEEEETTTRGHMVVSCAEVTFPYIEQCAVRYQTLYNLAYIDVTPTTSREALVDLVNGTCRIAVLSREPNAVEMETLKSDPERILRTQLAAYDAIAVIVHGDNPVEQLTVAQLKDIFTGKITNWSAVGGQDRPIRPLVRDRNSGTYEVFQDRVLGNEKYGANASPCSTMRVLTGIVEQDPGAIGLTGTLLIQRGYLKAIKIAEHMDGPYYKPSQESVYRERYPLRRPVVLCYFRDSERTVADLVAGFVSFVTSAMGQQLAVREGIVPATMPVRVIKMTGD